MQITIDNCYLDITLKITKRTTYAFRWYLTSNQCTLSAIEAESILFWSSDYSIDEFIEGYIDSPEPLLRKLTMVVLILRTFTKFSSP